MKAKFPLHLAFPLVLTACITYIKWFKRHNLPLTSDDIVSFEVAGTPQQAQAILDSWAQQGLTQAFLSSIYWDYPFILLYTATIILGCWWAAGLTRRSVLVRIGNRISGGLILAGLADVIENLAMTYSVLHAPKYWSTQLAAVAAYLKFGILAIGLLYFLFCLIFALVQKLRSED